MAGGRDRRLHRPLPDPGRAAPRARPAFGARRRGGGGGRDDRLPDPGKRRAARRAHLRPQRPEQLRWTRVATGTFRLDPPDAAEDAYWFNVTSWQGKDGPAHIDKPEQIGPGPLPDHRSRSTSTAPGRRRCACTRDASSPACRSSCPPIPRSRSSQVPVAAHMTRSFELDHHLLQREQKKGVPRLPHPHRLPGVGGISFALIFVVGFGLARLERHRRRPAEQVRRSAPGAGAKRPSRGRKAKTRPATA